MSHPEAPLDDGMLHAYLDGALPAAEAARIEARVAASPELQARLARARAMQAEADDLLALVELDPPLAAPAPAPSARGGVAAAFRTRFGAVDPIAFRWAASFAIIVGGIWLLTPTPSRESLSRGPGVEGQLYGDLREPGDTGPMYPVPDVAIAERPSPPAAGRSGADVAAPIDASAARTDASAEARKTLAAQTELNEAVRDADAARGARHEQAKVVASAVGAAPADEMPAPRPAPMADQGVGASRAAPAAAAPPPALAAAPMPTPPAARAAASTAQVPRRIDLAGAAALLGGNVRTLADARLERAEVLSDDPPVVRLTYRLADGAVVLFDQEPLNAPRATTDAAARARTQARAVEAARSTSQVRWSDGTLQLELQGRLSADSLRRIQAGVQKEP